MKIKMPDLSKVKPIEVYKMILQGEIKKFPRDYLTPNICKEIAREVILNELKFSREDICNNCTSIFFDQLHMTTFRKKFNYSLNDMVIYFFPEMNIKQWELVKTTDNFWKNKENQKELIYWLAEKENLDLNKLEDVQKINSRLLNNYGLSKAIQSAGGTYELLSTAIGDRFKRWEVINIPIWTEELAIEATKWLIEKKLHWSDEQVYFNLTAKTFKENSLGGMLLIMFNHSPLAALNLAYPGKYKELYHSKYNPRNKSQSLN